MTNTNDGWGKIAVKAVANQAIEVVAGVKPDTQLLLSGNRVVDIPGAPSPEDWITKRDELLMLWEAAKAVVEVAKADEMALRKAAVDFAFDPSKTKGTERVELGNGFEAKAVKKENVKLLNVIEIDGKEVTDAVDYVLSKIEELDDEGKFVAKRLVKWTPDLVAAEYKQLPERYKTIFDQVVETTQGAPTLEIVAPKGR